MSAVGQVSGEFDAQSNHRVQLRAQQPEMTNTPACLLQLLELGAET